MTHVGVGELTRDNCWIVNIEVDGCEVWLTLRAALGGLLALGSTFDAWGFSTLEEVWERVSSLQMVVT